MRKVFKEAEAAELIPYPLRCLSVSVHNFKPLHKLKLPTRKIDCVFQSVEQLADKETFMAR